MRIAFTALLCVAVALAELPGGFKLVCNDCGASMKTKCNDTSIMADGKYSGNGTFSLIVTVQDMEVLRHDDDVMCGKDVVIPLPPMVGGRLRVHGLDDCTGQKIVHWGGIDAEGVLMPRGFFNLYLETLDAVHTGGKPQLCVQAIVKRVV